MILDQYGDPVRPMWFAFGFVPSEAQTPRPAPERECDDHLADAIGSTLDHQHDI